jgi:hypothetical protein
MKWLTLILESLIHFWVSEKTEQSMTKSLEEADKIISSERQDQYGSPEDSFDRIARYWSVYLNLSSEKMGVTLPIKLDARDVALMMTLFKLAREQGPQSKRDNMIDAIGYLAIAADRL